MENILRMIYDKSKKNRIIELKDLEQILSLIIEKKDLQEYILNMSVQVIRSNNLASYSVQNKQLNIYPNIVNLMLTNLDKILLIKNDIGKYLYKNIRIVQIILHEIEHAVQEKNLYLQNDLETFLVRLSRLVENNNELYICNPEERFAEIRSFDEVILIINIIEDEMIDVKKILEADRLQRKLRGYHYKCMSVEAPTLKYFINGEKENLLQSFDWYDANDFNFFDCVEEYSLNERLFYGFPILTSEYSQLLSCLVKTEDKYFKNKVKIKKI